MFNIDLENARKVELEFLKKILKEWISRVDRPSKDKQFKDWDIKITYSDWTERTFEIKDCPRANEYGSIVFESECNWEPSGIFASKADYIVYHIWDERYRQHRWKLLHELVWINKYETMWWDNEKAKMYVVQNEIAKLMFKKL